MSGLSGLRPSGSQSHSSINRTAVCGFQSDCALSPVSGFGTRSLSDCVMCKMKLKPRRGMEEVGSDESDSVWEVRRRQAQHRIREKALNQPILHHIPEGGPYLNILVRKCKVQSTMLHLII